METTKRMERRIRRESGRLRPLFDRLETRQTRSASPVGLIVGVPSLTGLVNQVEASTTSPTLSVASISPASLSVLTQSPSELTVTFDRPINDFSLGSQDFALVHLASNGSTTPLSVGESHLVESLDSSDPTDRRISLRLTKPLVSGAYQLLLLGPNEIEGTDGTSLADHGSNVVLSTFRVGRVSTPLSSAVDLGTPGSIETIDSDTLDLSNNPGAVDYYKLTLAPGHHWRLGLEITAQQDGGTLASTLSLFDANGHLIATDSLGTPAFPNDPYLFAGLAPGTYYVGVSAQHNIPGATGYDFSQTVVSNTGTAQQGGPFRLHVVADIADQPTQVLGVELDRDDSLSTIPDGLTIQFSGQIATAGLFESSLPALQLVDRSGQVWPLSAINYNTTLDQLSLISDQALAPGQYRIELTGSSGLLDLAGYVPIAPGQSSGVLGSVTILPGSRSSGDLGILIPGAANSGLTSTIVVSPTTSLARQFTVIVPGYYSFSALNNSGGVNFTVEDSQSHLVGSGPGVNEGDSTDLYLTPGQYTLLLASSGNQASAIVLSILAKGLLRSSLMEGGVAQGPAFNLRLVTPQANFGHGSETSAPLPSTISTEIDSSSGGAPASNSGRDPGTTTSIPAIGSTTLGPSTSGILYSAIPLGRSTLQSNQISVVGPTGQSGSVALAFSGAGLPSGLMVVPTPIDPGGENEPEATPMDPEVQADVASKLRRGATLESGLLARSPGSRRADEKTLSDADWIGRLVTNAIGWLGQFHGAEPPVTTFQALAIVPSVSPGLETTIPDDPQVEVASVASPVGGVLAAMIAYRYRSKFLIRPRIAQKGESKLRIHPTIVGPHRRFKLPVS